MKHIINEPKRIVQALFYGLNGLKEALLTQPAFRWEVIASAVLVPYVLSIQRFGMPKKAVLIIVVLIVPVVELLNTAIEMAVNRISREHHALSKAAKDVGAAAVLFSLFNAALVWWIVW